MGVWGSSRPPTKQSLEKVTALPPKCHPCRALPQQDFTLLPAAGAAAARLREPRSQPDGDDQTSHVCPLLKVTEPVNREKELTEPKVLILSGLRLYRPLQNKEGWGGVQLRPGSGEESLSCTPCGCSLGCPQGAGRPSGKTLSPFLTGEVGKRCLCSAVSGRMNCVSQGKVTEMGTEEDQDLGDRPQGHIHHGLAVWSWARHLTP